MIRNERKIKNDGKTCNVYTKADIYGVTIRFDNSFTLRLNQDGIEDLIELLTNTGLDLEYERRDLDMSGEPFDQNGDLVLTEEDHVRQSVLEDAESASDEELEAVHDILKVWADEMEDYKHLLDLTQCSEI